MMSLVSPRAQRRVQGRGSGPSTPCAPAWGRWGHCWGQGQQWLLGAAGAHPHSLGWKLLCLAQQSPQCDPPCAVAVPVPVSLPGCGTSAGCQSPEPKLCSWGCPLLPCPALQELCCFSSFSLIPFGRGCRDCAFWCLLLISCQIFPLENIVPQLSHARLC